MLFVRGALQFVSNNPIGHLIIFIELALPAIGEAVPEETKHVGNDQGQNSHLDNAHNGQNSAIVGNLVITVRVVVAALEKVEHLLLRNELLGAQTRDSEHLEKKQITLMLIILSS